MASTLGSSAMVARMTAVVLVGMEAAAVGIGAVAYGVHGLTGSENPGLTWALAAMLGVLAVPLALAAYALIRGRRWSRSYALMWQVLQVAAGWYLVESVLVMGLVAIGVAVVAAILIVWDTRRDPHL